MDGGDYRTAGSWPGIRAAVNARLEEVSFRTGVLAGAVTFLVLAAATAALVLTVVPSHGRQANRVSAAPAAASSRVTEAATVPVAVPSAPATAHRSPQTGSPSAAPSSPATGAPSPARATPPSPAPSSSPRYDSARGAFGARQSRRGTAGGHRAGGRMGAGPSRGRTRVAFTWGPVRPGAPGRPGWFGR